MGIQVADGNDFAEAAPHEWDGSDWKPLASAWQWDGSEWRRLYQKKVHEKVVLSEEHEVGPLPAPGPWIPAPGFTTTITSREEVNYTYNAIRIRTTGDYRITAHIVAHNGNKFLALKVLRNGTELFAESFDGDTIDKTVQVHLIEGDYLEFGFLGSPVTLDETETYLETEEL